MRFCLSLIATAPQVADVHPRMSSRTIGSSATAVLTSNPSQNTLPEKFEACSPICGSLDQLEPVDVPFGDAVRRLIPECGGHGILVTHNALGKLDQFWQSTGLSAHQPWFQ